MLGIDRAPVDISSIESCDCWAEFSSFFTETIPKCFENTWNAVAEWVDTAVLPFFEDCKIWFEENAAWLWPVAIIFVGITATVLGIMFACVGAPQKENIKNDLPPLRERSLESFDSPYRQREVLTPRRERASKEPDPLFMTPPRKPHQSERYTHHLPSFDESDDDHSKESGDAHKGHGHKTDEDAGLCETLKQLRMPNTMPSAPYCIGSISPSTTREAVLLLFQKTKQGPSSPSSEAITKIEKLRHLLNLLDGVNESKEILPTTSSEAEDLIVRLEKELNNRYEALGKITQGHPNFTQANEQRRLIEDFEF